MEENKKLSEEEKLKAENDYLQMKIMLEHGAQFHFPDSEDDQLNPALKNEFLNNIIEFEKQWENQKRIKVFDKIGRPLHFQIVTTIPDERMAEEWELLSVYMQEHGIALDACSPKVTPRELYRFTTEELFNEDMDDISIPGMMTNFIYDEFYPDHEYDTTRFAIDDCINLILQKSPVKFMPWLGETGLQFNDLNGLNTDDFMRTINAIKEQYDLIDLIKIEEVCCKLTQDSSEVSGSYQALVTARGETRTISGSWLVRFVLVDYYWDAMNIQIGNL